MLIDLQTSYALDDSCQMQFWAKAHHSWGDFIEAVRVELAAEKRDDIPWWAVVQAPIKQVYRRTVPCQSSTVCDTQYVDQDKPGRGATPITTMEFWFPIHRPNVTSIAQDSPVADPRILKLEAALALFLDNAEEPPERNCSCHISPPCGDCVDYSMLREAFSDARLALQGSKL